MKTNSEILIITSYPPRECGIATYTQDLGRKVKEKFSRSFSPVICALENGVAGYSYPPEVKYVLKADENSDNYIDLAKKINSDDSVKCVLVQHEFGLFGGDMGEHLLYLLLNLNKPVITTFHTVLPNPDKARKLLVKTIACVCEKIIVMTNTSAKLLQKHYKVDSGKIEIIPHGVHLLPWQEKNSAKTRNGFKDKFVLTVFGLLSSNKSIETTLCALPEIKKHFPNVLFLILGKTHPGVIAQEGERYREYLELKVKELDIEENVKFVNKYLSIEELFDYLATTDIYIFTSKDPNQAVSGTFAYALASGCPIISTPIPHATEVLDGGMGAFFDFGNHGQLAKHVISFLNDSHLRNRMGLNAFHAIRPSAWENVSVSYAKLLAGFATPKTTLLYTYPAITLKHLFALTSPKGIIQFSILNKPDKSSGLTLDDNARALAVISMYYKTEKVFRTEFAEVYLNFIEYCQQADGSFLNYVDYDATFSPKNREVNLEDSNGRAVWALGTFLSVCGPLDYYMRAKAKLLLHKSLQAVNRFTSPRAISFAIKGLYLYNTVFRDDHITQLINKLARKLMGNYYDNFDHSWNWFEDYLTYANSIMPEAMLYAYLNSGEVMYKLIAKSSFDFLLLQIFNEGQINVVSNNGWKYKGKKSKKFGEQPIDVAYTIMALEQFYKVFGEGEYAAFMEVSFSWFLGNNHLHQTIYDPSTGGCCDGLEEHSVNLNQGAESTVCYLMARITMEEMKKNGGRQTILPVLQTEPQISQGVVGNGKERKTQGTF